MTIRDTDDVRRYIFADIGIDRFQNWEAGNASGITQRKHPRESFQNGAMNIEDIGGV